MAKQKKQLSDVSVPVRSSGTPKTRRKPAAAVQPEAPAPEEQPVNEPQKPEPELPDQTTDTAGLAGPGQRLVGALIGLLILGAAFVFGFNKLYDGKALPGVYADGQYVGGLTKPQIVQMLSKQSDSYQRQLIQIDYGTTTLELGADKIALNYDLNKVADDAIAHGRSGNFWHDFYQEARSIAGRPTHYSEFTIDQDKLAPYLVQMADDIDTPSVNAQLTFNGSLPDVVPAQSGKRLDIGLMVQSLQDEFASMSAATVTTPVYLLDPVVDTASLVAVKSQAAGYLNGPITINTPGGSQQASPDDIIGWIDVNRQPVNDLKAHPDVTDFAPPPITPVTLTLDDNKIKDYIKSLAANIDKPAVNAQLSMNNGQLQVSTPSQDGSQLDQDKAFADIKAALAQPADNRVVTLSVKQVQAQVREDDLSQLGITQLLSEGVTYFPGSSAARLINVSTGAAKFNDVLVAPGEVFSFGANLGDVGPETGYVPELVILGNHEEKQYGGGLCQVSSTMYRAALLAGLPINERVNHSFAVSYYTAPFGVPGVDATIYYPEVDFKFTNDTGHYILMQTIMQGTTLKFDFYGTKAKYGVIRGPYFVSPANGAGWSPSVPSHTVFYRDIFDLSGNLIKTDTINTYYQSSTDFPVQKQYN